MVTEIHGFRIILDVCMEREELWQESVYKQSLHALTKHPLITADIFLFNIGKSVDTLSEINYDMLEGIKDGELFTSKYDSQRITVNTPNILMVFSNDASNTSRLVKDRLKIFFSLKMNS